MKIEHEALGKLLSGETISNRQTEKVEKGNKVYDFAGRLITQFGSDEEAYTGGLDNILRKTPDVPVSINEKEYQFHLAEFTGSFGIKFRSIRTNTEVVFFELVGHGFTPTLGRHGKGYKLQSEEIDLVSTLLGYIETGLQTQAGEGQLAFSAATF